MDASGQARTTAQFTQSIAVGGLFVAFDPRSPNQTTPPSTSQSQLRPSQFSPPTPTRNHSNRSTIATWPSAIYSISLSTAATSSRSPRLVSCAARWTSGVSLPMSLLAMSTDVQDRDLPGRKRSHGDFLGQESCGSVAFRDSEHIQADLSLSDSKWQVYPLSK